MPSLLHSFISLPSYILTLTIILIAQHTRAKSVLVLTGTFHKHFSSSIIWRVTSPWVHTKATISWVHLHVNQTIALDIYFVMNPLASNQQLNQLQHTSKAVRDKQLERVIIVCLALPWDHNRPPSLLLSYPHKATKMKDIEPSYKNTKKRKRKEKGHSM